MARDAGLRMGAHVSAGALATRSFRGRPSGLRPSRKAQAIFVVGMSGVRRVPVEGARAVHAQACPPPSSAIDRTRYPFRRSGR
jgi:hypothetical protein